MRIIATIMVRDEADIIAATVEHLVSQGIDRIIVTDNGSVDGTTEILEDYATAGVVDLYHDPVHRKQQGSVVTEMARLARTEHAADWVLNVDADEFWKPVDRQLTLRDALEATPLSLNAFTVPVINLVGPPANQGSGIDRLVWRDHRSTEQLNQVGIHAQPTDNCVHRGDPTIVVSQGNHFVSLSSNGSPRPELSLEVLHMPWRSWRQFELKVTNAGRSYEANPTLQPSKNHHGMADYRRYRAGRLEFAFLSRQPTERDLAEGATDGTYVHDTWLKEHLHLLAGKAVRRDHLAAVLDSAYDELVPAAEHERAAAVGRMFVALEEERDAALKEAAGQGARATKLRRQLDRARLAPTASLRARVRRSVGHTLRAAQRRLSAG